MIRRHFLASAAAGGTLVTASPESEAQAAVDEFLAACARWCEFTEADYPGRFASDPQGYEDEDNRLYLAWAATRDRLAGLLLAGPAIRNPYGSTIDNAFASHAMRVGRWLVISTSQRMIELVDLAAA